MRWQVWQRSGPQELPTKVRHFLSSQFRLDSQSAGKLRFLGKSGRFARRPVRFIRIFDPALIQIGQVVSLKYDDLEMDHHRKALLFNGHIEADGAVYLLAAA